jgi:hydrogenase maturation protease
MSPRVLVAGVGNVFLGDDGFGVEVARRLDGERFPEGVQVADFGIRGVHLAYELLEGYDLLILIDAAPRGEAPGTVFVLEPDFGSSGGVARGESGFLLDAHSLDPEVVLGILADLGGRVGRVVIVGCEPAEVIERMGLSEPVARAADEAARVVRELIARACDGTSNAAPEDAAMRREAAPCFDSSPPSSSSGSRMSS